MDKTRPRGATPLFVGILCLVVMQISVDACRGTNEFCRFYNQLDFHDQAIVNELIDDVQHSLQAYQKRSDYTKKAVEPNFLRFGKRSAPSNGANFLRFGKSGADPNFLRFGKRAAVELDGREPNFLRFGRPDPSNNFLRFGRANQFERDQRQNNFLRFG